MKNLITMSNLTFTKKKCNCGLTYIKSKTKKTQNKSKIRKNIKTKYNKLYKK